MSRYYAQTEGHIMPTYRRGGGGRANLDGSVPVLGRIGTSAPKGYVQTGTTIKSNKAGDKTFAIYTPISQVQSQAPAPTPTPTEPPPPPPPPEPPKPQGPDYGQQIADAMAAADARMADLMNQFKIQQAAAEERQRLAAEAQRQQMLTMQRRDRAASRAPNLQIRGAGETPSTAGTQGFRRRKDQFRITPFQGIGGILGVAGQVAQGAANKMVNI
tara:strand:- start:34 stop:678 length:645 start_codon:yes stop_codon:yes gene_type:complete